MNKNLKLFALVIGLVSTIMLTHVFVMLNFFYDSYTIYENIKFIKIIELIITVGGVFLLGKFLREEVLK